MKRNICTGCSSRAACIAMAALVASMAQPAFARTATAYAKTDGSEMNAPTLKEMLESGQVIMIKSRGNITFGIPNGDGITQKAASRTGIVSALANKAKKLVDPSWIGIANTAKLALKKAGNYFAKAGADGHYTGTGVAAIGA